MASCSQTRLPVTMRLSSAEVEIIKRYAESNGVTKTDAFLHFLRRGIEGSDYDMAKLNHAESMLEGIFDAFRILQT